MTKQIQQRLPDDLAAAIDERARSVDLSRNEWINRALAWATAQPIKTITTKEQL